MSMQLYENGRNVCTSNGGIDFAVAMCPQLTTLYFFRPLNVFATFNITCALKCLYFVCCYSIIC